MCGIAHPRIKTDSLPSSLKRAQLFKVAEAVFALDKISGRETSDMDSNTDGMQRRWNEDNINLNVAGTGLTGFYNRFCTGTMGIALKVSGALALLVAVYMIGYITGYYIHKC
ncbi:hypothetical protein UPYG_G00008490 [Umbra pygmaea]|uniref:Small integral membrane protein 1 n=1 Tax=Umbra pygmaea TaxID=75934 RepID=A0ABD0XI19_UMBPY